MIELTVKGLNEMSLEELTQLDGGGFFEDAWNGVCKGVTSITAGAVAGAKVGAVTCTPVGIIAGAVTGILVETAWDYIF